MPDPAPSAADLTGRTLDDYHVLRKLGAGGMGQVYLARQQSLKREVALKFLRNDLNSNPTALKRFQAEAEAVARLNHPNIVQVYAVGQTNGLRFMALEYVEGRNLRDFLARKGPPELPVALTIMRQVAAALQKAHDHGIVHRDIKPENILLTRRAEVKVTDFGLSRFFAGAAEAVHLTQSGVTVGTPLYISPEQAQGHAVDHRSDLYSFGVTCFHLLAGEPPFTGATAVEVSLKHITEQPRPLASLRPDLPPDLCAMVHRMMAKAPADRYASARDIIRDLGRVKEGLALAATQHEGVRLSRSVGDGPTPLGLTTTTTPAVRPVRWRRWILAGLVCGAAAGGGVAAALSHPQPDPPDPPPPPAVAGPGLPDVRLPDHLAVTPRERELLALVGSRDTRPDDYLAGSVELGLLHVKNRRLDDAHKRFEKLDLEGATFRKGDAKGFEVIGAFARPAGKLGQAVVLAHRDDPAKSNELFAAAFQQPLPKLPDGPPAKGAGRVPAVMAYCWAHYPELAVATTDGLNRNLANLGGTKLTEAALEAARNSRPPAKKP